MSRKKTKTSEQEPGTVVQDPADYEVGYAKPPKATRFQPGVSGNPAGRPRGSKNRRPWGHEERLKEIVLDEAYRTIPVRDGDKTVSVPVAQAVIRSLGLNAAKGNLRAQERFTELLTATEASRKRQHDEYLQTMCEYKVYWEHELERRKRLGIEGPEPLPHPDDIEIDLDAGTVIMHGPRTPEEKARWEILKAHRRDLLKRGGAVSKRLREETDPETIAALKAEFDAIVNEIEKIWQITPPSDRATTGSTDDTKD